MPVSLLVMCTSVTYYAMIDHIRLPGDGLDNKY